MRSLVALCLAVLATPAAAQGLEDTILRLLPDEHIQVRASGAWTEGRFVTNRIDSLFFRGPSGPGSLAYSEITGLRRRVSQRNSGIVAGMMFGGPSLAYWSGRSHGSASDALLAGLGGMVIGGFVGGLIGSATHRWNSVFDVGGAPAPRIGSKGRIAARVGYVTSSTNKGVAASLIALPGTFGIELSYFPMPADDVTPPPQVYFYTDVPRSGSTFEPHLVGQWVVGRGRVRPMLRVGAGPTVDFLRFDRYQGDGFGNIVGVSDESRSDFHFGFDASPGVRIGSGSWGLAVEGTYHLVAGRGRYSDFAGVWAGANWH